MTLVLQYKFDQANVAIDSFSNTSPTNRGVTSVVDSTYGNVALFEDNTNFILNNPPSAVVGTSTRTFSVWINSASFSNYDVIFDCGTTDPTRLALFVQNGQLKILSDSAIHTTTAVQALDTWYNVVSTFDGTSVRVYRDGLNVYSATHSVNTTNPLYIGSFNTFADFDGKMSDFRIYSYALDSSEVSTLYSNGPGSDAPLQIPPLSVVPRPTNMAVMFTEVTGAIGYNVTIEGPTGGELLVLSGVTELEHNITGLDPETQYTVKLYADTGTGYDLIEEEVTITLSNVAANYDVTDFVRDDGIIELKTLPDSTIVNITEVMNDIFNTGDLVSLSVAENPVSFIKLDNKLNISNLNGVLLPFIEDTTPGQAASVTLSDGITDVIIDFDETSDSVNIGGIVYSDGDSFILDRKKATVVRY